MEEKEYLRYAGEFVSVGGVVWRVELHQKAYYEFSVVGELEFPADSPLSIEWGRTDKEVPVQGATATLKVISPDDRTYSDLYTIEPGRVRMRVFKNGVSYWTGSLDPEFYEEPYESAFGYEVGLTFSDFGILDRIDYRHTGVMSVRNIVMECMALMGIAQEPDISLASSEVDAGDAGYDSVVYGLSVRSENFYDEDGEPSSWREVLEGVLQPLALRIVQRSGKVFVYDLNGLYTKGEGEEIMWDGDSQTLGTDKVANKVKITFSPYSDARLLSGEMEYGGKYEAGKINTSPLPQYPDDPGVPPGYGGLPDGEYGIYYSFFANCQPNQVIFGENAADFTIFTHHKAESLRSIGPGCRYFHIEPVTGSEESEGVAYKFFTRDVTQESGVSYDTMPWNADRCVSMQDGAITEGGHEVLTSERVFIPATDPGDQWKFLLRLTQEVLIDTRYNPFSGEDEWNYNENDDRYVQKCDYVFIPAKVTLRDGEGNALYHYRNLGIASGTPGRYGEEAGGDVLFAVVSQESTFGEWVEGEDPGGDCWLEYYDPETLKYEGFHGWCANRQCFGRRNTKDTVYVSRSFKNMEDGQYIPMPPVSGFLEVQVLSGFRMYRYGTDAGVSEDGFSMQLGLVQFCHPVNFGGVMSLKREDYAIVRWILYKAPSVTVVRNDVAMSEAELDDIEYSGYINRQAADDIELDTICGTSEARSPATRGSYLNSYTGYPLGEIRRAGISGPPERLLIGTLCSQYDTRRTTLSGEAVADTGAGLRWYSDRNQPDDVRLMMMEDVQDLITDCSDIEVCEFRPDEYEAESEEDKEEGHE